MCLKIESRQRRESCKAYKIVVANGFYEPFSLYWDYTFKTRNRWQKQARRKTSLTMYEKDGKEINGEGYHLFSTLAAAKEAFKHLPGNPQGCIENREIWECEVRPKNFIARGTFKLKNNTKVSSVVYNTFKFIKKVN